MGSVANVDAIRRLLEAAIADQGGKADADCIEIVIRVPARLALSMLAGVAGHAPSKAEGS